MKIIRLIVETLTMIYVALDTIVNLLYVMAYEDLGGLRSKNENLDKIKKYYSETIDKINGIHPH